MTPSNVCIYIYIYIIDAILIPDGNIVKARKDIPRRVKQNIGHFPFEEEMLFLLVRVI